MAASLKPALPSAHCGGRRRLLAGLFAAVAVTVLPAQQSALPQLTVLWHGDTAMADLPAVATFRSELLPQLAAAASSLPAAKGLLLRWQGQHWQLSASEQVPTAGDLFLATLTDGAGRTAHGCCRLDGTEDWWIPLDFAAPTPWREALACLQLDRLQQPRTLDAAILLAHLTGASVDGDRNRSQLQLAAACGEVTFVAWTTDRHLRLRGRSDGGLLLPAALLLANWPLAPSAELQQALQVCASRDSQRGEALRQLLLADNETGDRLLRANLHAEDELRLTAIVTLVQRQAAADLPRIAAAATASEPLSVLAATDAVLALWPLANQQLRSATTTALRSSEVGSLRELASNLPRTSQVATTRQLQPTADEATAAAASQRARWLLGLLCLLVCTYGLWLRERRQRKLLPTIV